MKNFLKFSRLHTIIGTSLSVSGLYLIAWARQSPADPQLLHYLVALLACLAANVYIVGLNQITDVDIDRINKPELPLASGAWSMRTAHLIVWSCLAIAIVLALLEGLFLSITVVASLIIGTAYSLPPIRLKRFHFWAAFCIFAVRGLIVNLFLYLHFNFLLYGRPEIPAQIWLLTVFMFGMSLVIAWFKDIPDMEGDQQFRIATLSLRFGPQRVLLIGKLLLTACYGLMIGAGLAGLPGVNREILIWSHLALLLIIWWRAHGVDATDQQATTRLYMFIWVLFFMEYLLFSLACILPPGMIRFH